MRQVLSEEHACIRVAVEAGANEGYQFKTHPNIDKAQYSQCSVLGLKDVDRPFPTGSPLGILKWRMQVSAEGAKRASRYRGVGDAPGRGGGGV